MRKILLPIFNADPPYFGRLEFILATGAFLFAAVNLPEELRTHELMSVPLEALLLSGIFKLVSLYAGFVLLNFYAVPAFITYDVRKGLLITFAVFGLLVLAFRKFDIALPALAIFIVYTAFRYAGLYLWRNADSIYARYRFISPVVIMAISIWLFGILPCLFSGEEDLIAFWITVIPSAIFFYTFAVHSLAPTTIYTRYPFLGYTLRVIVLLLILTAVIFVTTIVTTGHEDAASIFSLINFLFHFLVTAPITWLLYKKSVAGKEVSTLKKELGQSVASFDFLRSQINPHFLFNALNTLYGMAIIENASRTSEGIQRLGDMMRFMLHENMQEKIPLSREIEYLQNYIALQKLRVDSTPGIRVEASIGEDVFMGTISPMLLIPFVENAFKHGISFRDPSHIIITLEVKNEILYFDIHNSKHIRQGVDPEKDHSGIGLKNVRQRLEHLYPKKHELIVRETVSEFFVHLTLQLSLSRT
jgi:two-component system LytT family sensor kinase